MAYSVLNLESDLSGILHGTTLNKIQNLDGVISRAARQLLLDIDPQETKRLVDLVPIFNSVYDYACPTDLKGNRVIDIRPQVNRLPTDILTQHYNQDFDANKQSWNDMFTINFDQAVKTLRISIPTINAGTVLNNLDSTTGNGTFTATGDASNLQTDNINYAAGSGALKFDLAAGGTVGNIVTTTQASVDLSDYLNTGSAFLWVYLPDASDFTSVGFQWGSSVGNCYLKSTTVNQQGNVFEDGWNLLEFDWLGATVIGSPDVTDITYMLIYFTYNGDAQTAVRVDQAVFRNPAPYQIEYYSKYLFRDSISNAFQEAVTDNSNLINLDLEAYNLLLYQTAIMASQQAQGYNATNFDYQFFQNGYQNGIDRYKRLYKSEVSKPRITYYRQPNPRYTNYYNRRPYN